MLRFRPLLSAVLALSLATAGALGQARTYELDPETGTWIGGEPPAEGTDARVIYDARRALAEENASRAASLLGPWIKANERTENPWLPEAYMLRGDARVATGREFKALYDYERVAKDYPSSEVFIPTLERELEVARMYLGGLRKKFLGLVRIESGTNIGIELMMRIQERVPGSQLAETAAIELADYFYRVRELDLAAEMYSIFLVNYPRSDLREHAMLRQIYANVAMFKGPRYDASSLIEARALIRAFESEYPVRAEELGITGALIARLDESSAAQMLETAEWYLRRDDEFAGRFTLQRLVIRHDGTVAAARGAELLDDRGWEVPRPTPLSTELEEMLEGAEDEPTPEDGP